MFERFTERARRVVVLAQSEARLLNHNYIGTEHILLGISQEGDGVGAKALESLGIPREQVRDQVIDLIGEGQAAPTGHIPFTPRAKKVLELALRESIQMGHDYIGTEHLLLGIVREGEGVAAQILAKRGADQGKVRHTVAELLSGYKESPQAEGVETEPRKPTKGPSCARCKRPLEETARYRVIDVPDVERAGEKTTVTVVYCGACGTSLGTLA